MEVVQLFFLAPPLSTHWSRSAERGGLHFSHVDGFGLFLGFVVSRRNTKYVQPYPVKVTVQFLRQTLQPTDSKIIHDFYTHLHLWRQ